MGCRLRYLLLLGLLVLTCLVVVTERVPQYLSSADSSPTQFSVARARVLVDTISRQPHPVGSAEHETIREFIRAELKRLGLAVGDQRSKATLRMAGTEQSATIQNVLGVIPGSDPGAKAILLVAHYDSVRNSRGASDDGAAVAALLETARALLAGPKLRHSIYFLFSDAEEVGLLGAQAFVQEHPLAHKVGFALNFEARGTKGPLLMYQTSPNNGELMRAFDALAPYPHANSLISQLARILPNDTDASLLTRASYPVLGFAFVEGFEHYHQYTDSSENLDSRSLSHCGRTALDLARGLGQMEILPKASSDAVYFDLFGRKMIRYPVLLARLLGTLVAISWIGLLRRELLARRVTTGGIGRGVRIQVLAVVMALVVPVMLHLLRMLMIDPFSLDGNAAVYGWADLLVVTALNLLFYGSAIRQITLRELVLGGLALSAALSILLGWFLPDASAAWQWITLVSLIVWRFEPNIPQRNLLGRVALQHVPLVAAILILSPIVVSAVADAGPSLMPIALMIAASVTCLFLPTLLQREFPKLYLLSGGAGTAGFALMLIVTLHSNLSHAGPRQNSLIYTYDGPTKTAHLATETLSKDAWVERSIRAGATVGPLHGFSLTPESWRQVVAPDYPLQPSRIEVRDTTLTADKRLIELRIDAPEPARCVRLWQSAGPPVSTVSVNHKPVEQFVRFSPEFDELGMQLYAGQRAGHIWNLRHCGFGGEPLLINLQAPKQPGIKLRLVEERESFPEPMLRQLTPRPPGFVPAQNSDETWIGQDIVL